MLVLSRKKGQSIMIGNDIEISIIDIQGEQVRLGINAPGSIKVYRKEVYDEIIKENREAAIIDSVKLLWSFFLDNSPGIN